MRVCICYKISLDFIGEVLQFTAGGRRGRVSCTNVDSDAFMYNGRSCRQATVNDSERQVDGGAKSQQ